MLAVSKVLKTNYRVGARNHRKPFATCSRPDLAGPKKSIVFLFLLPPKWSSQKVFKVHELRRCSTLAKAGLKAEQQRCEIKPAQTHVKNPARKFCQTNKQHRRTTFKGKHGAVC